MTTPPPNDAPEPNRAAESPQPPPPEPFSPPQPPPPEPFSPRQPPPAVRPASKLSPTTNRYDHELARWGLGDAAASIAVFFIGSFAIVLLIAGLTDSDSFLEGPLLPIAVVGPHVLMLSHIIWVARTKGTSLTRDFQFRFEWADSGRGIGLFVLGVIAAGLVAATTTALTGEPPTSAAIDLAQESAEESGGGLTIWLVLFGILGATLVPVVEELVYRGLMWSALEKRGARPWTILVVTSTIFALIHLEPARTPVLFVIGMAIGAGRLVTGRIGPSIAAHVIFNSLAMTAALSQLAN